MVSVINVEGTMFVLISTVRAMSDLAPESTGIVCRPVFVNTFRIEACFQYPEGRDTALKCAPTVYSQSATLLTN